jgi:hypothetical protein
VSTTLYGVISGFCSFIMFIVYVAFLIVTTTAVRARRPDAWSPLASGAGILVADYALRWSFSFLAPIAMSRAGSGMSSFYDMQASIAVAGTIIGVIAWGLIMIGVVRIASPPREQNLNRAPGDY